MTKDEVTSLFTLAKIPILRIWELRQNFESRDSSEAIHIFKS